MITAGLLAWLVLRPTEPDLRYQGKALRAWLSDYTAVQKQDAQSQAMADEAIREIGTNAIPILLNMLRQKDSYLVSKVLPFWDQHIGKNLPPRFRSRSLHMNRAQVLDFQAFKGIAVLRPSAQQVVPSLIEIYDENISPRSQMCVIESRTPDIAVTQNVRFSLQDTCRIA